MEEILNGKITATRLTMEDYASLVGTLTIEGAGWGVNYGCTKLGHGYLGADEFIGSAYGTEAIMRLMDTVGVAKWEDLKGKYVRVKFENSLATEIGNITENKWFSYKKLYEEKYKNES